jgi:hypothetical protein
VIALLALATAVPPLGTAYLVRRRAQGRRPSTYARDRDQRFRQIRQNLEQLGASENTAVKLPVPTRARNGGHPMPEMVVLPTNNGFCGG